MTLTLILLAIGNMLLLMAIRSLRAQRLKERHALLFAAVGVPFLGLAIWPDGIGWIAARLGIEYQTVLLLAVTTFFKNRLNGFPSSSCSKPPDDNDRPDHASIVK